MSTKSTIFLTNDANEHCYFDCAGQHISRKTGQVHDEITIEFSKKNIIVEGDDDEDLIITITNVDSELYKIFEQLINVVPKELK